ncbi:MAG: HAD-IIIA family hydrolase [Phycisphaerales bacterium]|nr:HAD-IIIA family hydrolase [Phycisphaerales bacterium]
MRPAVFIDRDDTLNLNTDLPAQAWGAGRRGDLLNPAFVQLLPRALEACVRLRDAGFTLVVYTNQSGVAFGSGTLRDVDATNARLDELLTVDGERLIEAFYSSPFHPEGTCEPFNRAHDWRKPGPGMIVAAARELGIDLDHSWIVGDHARDREAGIAAGIAAQRALKIGPEEVHADLAEAAEHIIRAAEQARGRGAATTIVRLRAENAALLDEAAETVLSSGRAIAERTGVRVVNMEVRGGQVEAVLETHRLAALGFAGELRRAVNRWAAARFGRGIFAEAPGNNPNDNA